MGWATRCKHRPAPARETLTRAGRQQRAEISGRTRPAGHGRRENRSATRNGLWREGRPIMRTERAPGRVGGAASAQTGAWFTHQTGPRTRRGWLKGGHEFGDSPAQRRGHVGDGLGKVQDGRQWHKWGRGEGWRGGFKGQDDRFSQTRAEATRGTWLSAPHCRPGDEGGTEDRVSSRPASELPCQGDSLRNPRLTNSLGVTGQVFSEHLHLDRYFQTDVGGASAVWRPRKSQQVLRRAGRGNSGETRSPAPHGDSTAPRPQSQLRPFCNRPVLAASF